MNVFWIVIITTLLVRVEICSSCERDSFGKHFIFGMTGEYIPLSEENVHLHVTPASNLSAHVLVTAPFLNLTRTYIVSNSTILTFNGRLIHYEDGTQLKGVEVRSDVDISLTVVTGISADYFEGFLVLPTNALGTKYIAASYRPIYPFDSEFLVASIENDTDVVLNISLNGHRHGDRVFRLQKFETYQFKSRSDVTGSVITSNKPVAVISGAALVNIPSSVGDTQSLSEQLIPIKYWTTKYILPPIYPRKHFVVKFFAAYDGTVVQYYSRTMHHRLRMNKWRVIEKRFDTDPITVVANKPISIIEYGHDGDNMAGDPFMMTVQGLSQFVNSYRFVTQSFYSEGSNTLVITINRENASEIMINGRSVAHWNATSVSVAKPLGHYITMFVNVSSNSSYHVSHSGGMHFGALLYARPGIAAAYGHPLRLSLSSTENCTSSEKSTTSPVPSTVSTPASTSALSTSPTSALSTSPSPQPNSTTVNEKWCFHCENITNLKSCSQVQRCQNKNEICYVRRFQSKSGGNLYTSGCMTSDQCSSSQTNGGCLQCCKDNFCNSAGCGDHGYQDPGSRGPLCMNCSNTRQKDMCSHVQLCQSDQVCLIEKYDLGNGFQYNMGCTQVQACTSKRSIDGRTGRDVPICSHCCRPDFCNLNCATTVDPGTGIIGTCTTRTAYQICFLIYPFIVGKIVTLF